MQKDFLKYAYEKHKLLPDEIDSYVQLELVAGEYLFKNKKGEKKHEPNKKIETERDVFDEMCENKLGDTKWNKVTEISHAQVRIADSVTPVYALDVMYDKELHKRLVMRDYKKSLRFTDHVCVLWFSRCEQID